MSGFLVTITTSISDGDLVLQYFLARIGLQVVLGGRLEDGWVLVLSTDEEVDLVMSPNTRVALAQDGIIINKVPQYRDESTIVASRLPAAFRNTSTQELASVIAAWNDVEVASVTFVSLDTIEIELNTPEDVGRLLRAPGGLALGLNINITRLERKKFTKVDQCGRCYSLDHNSRECTSPEPICYHCANTGHTGDECSTRYIRCINCNDNHVAFAGKCSLRKAKEEEIRQREQSLEAGASNGVGAHGDHHLANRQDRSEEQSANRQDRSEEQVANLDRSAEEEVDLIMGIDRLLLQDNPTGTRQDSNRAAYPREPSSPSRAAYPREPPSPSRAAYPREPPSPSRAVYPREPPSPSRAVYPREPSLQPEDDLQAFGFQASGCVRSPSRAADHLGSYDPLPVSPRRTVDPNRPPSRLEDPMPTPLYRPLPRTPRRHSLGGASGMAAQDSASRRRNLPQLSSSPSSNETSPATPRRARLPRMRTDNPPARPDPMPAGVQPPLHHQGEGEKEGEGEIEGRVSESESWSKSEEGESEEC